MNKSLLPLAVIGMTVFTGSVQAQDNSAPANTQNPTNATQSQQTTPSTQDTQSMPGMQNQMQAGEMDTRFLKAAYQGGLAEIELSRVAMKQAQSPALRRFARMMVSQHSEVNGQIRRLASMENIELPTGLAPADRAAMERLQQRQGNQFDQSYAFLMNHNHRKDTELYQQAITMLQDPQIRAFAQRTLPAIQNHYQMIAEYRDSGRMPMSQMASSRTMRNRNGGRMNGNNRNRMNNQGTLNNGDAMNNNRSSNAPLR